MVALLAVSLDALLVVSMAAMMAIELVACTTHGVGRGGEVIHIEVILVG